MNVLSACSGIGAMDLGLERAGMTIVGQVEIDPFCQRVLAKHWPEVARHDDVRTCVEWWLAEPRPAVDVIAAGIPCQPASVAGRRRGDGDDRWLWPDVWTLVDAVRPRWVLLENVPGILTVRLSGRGNLDGRPTELVGIAEVLRTLAEGGYDAQWDHVPASAVGAPHRRDRWLCIARLADPEGDGRGTGGAGGPARPGDDGPDVTPTRLADAHGSRREPWAGLGRPWPAPERDGWWTPQSDVGGGPTRAAAGLDRGVTAPWERGIPRLAGRVPDQAARLRALGNAVVPQVAEHVGRLIMDTEAGLSGPPGD